MIRKQHHHIYRMLQNSYAIIQTNLSLLYHHPISVEMTESIIKYNILLQRTHLANIESHIKVIRSIIQMDDASPIPDLGPRLMAVVGILVLAHVRRSGCN